MVKLNHLQTTNRACSLCMRIRMCERKGGLKIPIEYGSMYIIAIGYIQD